MKEEYYTPNIEDIKVGYECEVQNIIRALTHSVDYVIRTDIVYDENWVKVIVDYPVYLQIHYYIELLESTHLRTPYLTKEQIEAEGWKFIGTVLCKLNYQVYLENTQLHITDHNGDTYFLGECKSINEFRYICKLLKI